MVAQESKVGAGAAVKQVDLEKYSSSLVFKLPNWSHLRLESTTLLCFSTSFYLGFGGMNESALYTTEIFKIKPIWS